MNNTDIHTDTDTDTDIHTHKTTLSLQHPDNGSFSSTIHTPVLNHNLLNTKHLSIDIPNLKDFHNWNDFDETNNQIPTMDVSPIYANNNPYSRKFTGQSRKSTQQDQPHTNSKPDKSPDNSHSLGERSILIQICLYLFGGDSHNN
jgi:hypothetical protein